MTITEAAAKFAEAIRRKDAALVQHKKMREFGSAAHHELRKCDHEARQSLADLVFAVCEEHKLPTSSADVILTAIVERRSSDGRRATD